MISSLLLPPVSDKAPEGPGKRRSYQPRCYAKQLAVEGIQKHGPWLFPLCPALRELWDQHPPEKEIRRCANAKPADLDCIGRIGKVCNYLSSLAPSFDSLALFAHRTSLLTDCLNLIRIDLRSLPKRLERDYPTTADKCRRLAHELEAAEKWYALWRPTHLFLLPRCYAKPPGGVLPALGHCLGTGRGGRTSATHRTLAGFEGVPFPPDEPLPVVDCTAEAFLEWQRSEPAISKAVPKMSAMFKGLPGTEPLSAHAINYYPAAAIVAAGNLLKELRVVAKTLKDRASGGRSEGQDGKRMRAANTDKMTPKGTPDPIADIEGLKHLSEAVQAWANRDWSSYPATLYRRLVT